MARRLVVAFDPGRLERVGADAERHATRLLANAVVNVAWRNGPIEDVHAGTFRGYPLDRRRIAPAEEADLMCHVAAGMALGVSVCRELVFERPRRPWTEQVLPYGLAEMMLITPSGWSLTEATRAIRLPA